MIAKIGAAPPDLTAAAGHPWRNPISRRRRQSRPDAGDWPVATMPGRILAAIGGRSPTVRVSAWQAAKQADRHPDLAPEEYARVQCILDGCEAFRGRAHHTTAFLETNGRFWRAVLKATADGSETGLASLHKAKPRD